MAKNSIKVYKTQMKAKVTKAFQKEVELMNTNLMRVVDNKLYRTYKDNLIASYDPRSDTGKEIKEYNKDEYTTHRKKVSYHHTGILARSIDTQVEGNTTRIIIKDDEIYDNGKKPSEVIEMLKHGTSGGEYYPYVKKIKGNSDDPNNYKTGWAYNYPTPKHPFEEHTKNEMNVFCEQLVNFMRKYNNKNAKKYAKDDLRLTFANFHRKFKDEYGYLMRKRY